jgi:CDGSH iron-sulfur domain-containing protein 3
MSVPTIAQKGPYPVQVGAGKSYYWCSCGLSKNQPFRDGSHAGTGLSPIKFEAAENEGCLPLRQQERRLLRR